MEQFVVSARKYRPATFASVVGQKHITSTLKNAIERNQLAHAYLFCGPRGVGKTTCARIFAKAINCLNPNGSEACNECDSCRSFNEGRSLNIHELDAASNNSVEDIRNLIEQVRVIPQIGHYSVFIIDEVHMLSQAAFNAFLKTLEEPPQHAIFILATTEKHKIIPTILSRCQIYDFNRIRVEDAVEYLRYIAQSEGVTADEESLNLIAQKADGGMRDALSMFDKAVSFCGANLEYKTVAKTLNVLDYDTYFRFTELLIGGDYVNALLEFDTVLAKGFSGQIFIQGLGQHMRDLLVAKGPAVTLIEYTGTLLDRYTRQAQVCDTSFLFGAISLLSETDSRLRTTSNQRLLVELALMKIAAIGQKKNDDLILPEQQSYPLPNLDENKNPVNQSVTVPQPQPTAVEPTQARTTQAPQAKVEPQTETLLSPSAIPPQGGVVVSGGGRKPASQNPFGSGSITSLLKSVSVVKDGDQQTDIHLDPKSEEKLLATKERFVATILELHPRLNMAFDKMTISGNKLTVEVPVQTLADDLKNNRSQILDLIAETAQINGSLEMEIILNEIEVKTRPVKLEDRLEHIAGCSPLFSKIVEALDLEAD
ncbi:MAG: DNA polymerase III subunit gamma/tau [Alistipes sp.]|nr:DNA polymerase III subunit gamma/tau [Alistipes sp.]